MMIVIC